jgi:hypothetical protein
MRGWGRGLLIALAVVAAVLVPATTEAAPKWAPAATAPIHPGVQTFSPSGQCTANFIFANVRDVFIGQAAHCTTMGGPRDVNGCTTASHPYGTKVSVTGATRRGTMIYNSWNTMKAKGETDSTICSFNDIALVRLDRTDHKRVNPSLPHWGGPTGLTKNGAGLGALVYSYGRSGLRDGLEILSPRTGISLGLGSELRNWVHLIEFITPGLPGDSGSAVLDASGKALGILATLGAGFNGVGDLSHELAYMWSKTNLDAIKLVPGTVPFNPTQLPLEL